MSVTDAIQRPFDRPPPRWLPIVLWLLAVPNLVIGLWAHLAPEHWFETFPGWSPYLVAAYPPFNEHLASDAGAGLLTIGVLAAAAAVIRRRDAVLVAGAGVLAFTGPHALFHVLNPSDLLSASEDAMNTAPLVLTAVGGLAVLWAGVVMSRDQP
jgi:hypothetical protein